MGATKTDIFTENQNRLAEMAKAIGHPARIAILEYLAKQNNCVCGSIVDEIGLAQATVSQHLKALKNVGLIMGTVDGAKTCYCLDTKNLNNMKEGLNALINQCCTDRSCC